MGLRCARLSCGQEAAASLQFDNAAARVVIIDLTDSVAGIPICRSHVTTRTPPMGWTMDDRRTVTQPSLWTEPSPTEPTRRQVPMIERSVPMIDRAPETPPSPGPRSTNPVGPVASAPPVFDFRRSEQISGPPPESVTGARSPLLSRAFRID